MADKSYHTQVDIKNTLKLRELLRDLPPYTRDFFRGIEPLTSSRTRIAYAYDLNVFFRFLHENNPVLGGKELKLISLSDLESLTPMDIEEYLDYVKVYEDSRKKAHTNDLGAIKRKLASLRTFYKYFYQKELIHYDPAALVPMPKLHEKNIVRLDADEVAELLDNVESGSKLTHTQLVFHEKTKVRDLAIVTLLLGTGIRVSECVGLYMDERESLDALPGHEDALFLSGQKKRINVRTVENLVKKYTQTVTQVKNITPHKLRSTYGTNLYRATGDIYLVAGVLGHSDVNTTRKHYAAIEEEQRRQARNKVHLRHD